jgi:hypothetical protein
VKNKALSHKMKKIALLSILSFLCLFLSSFLIPVFSGKWKGELIKPDSSHYPLTYNFIQSGNVVSGTARSELGEFPLQEGEIDSSGLHFRVTVQGLDIYHHAILYADSIGMDITLNGATVHCKLKQAAN